MAAGVRASRRLWAPGLASGFASGVASGLALFVAVGLASPANAQTPTLKEATTTLTAMRAELEQKQAALSGLNTAESSLVTSLGELDESVARLDDDRRQGAAQLIALQTEIATLERDAGIDEEELARLRARLQARMKALVVDGEGGTARALLGAEGFTELALRRRYVGALADTDARLVKDVRRVEVSALQKRDALRSRLHEAAMMQKRIDEQQALLVATRDERRLTLERIRSEKTVLRRAATELNARHRELQFLVAKLAEGPRYKPPTGRTGILRRGMAWPVMDASAPRPPWSLIRRFGSVKDQNTGAEIVSNGVELRADAGSAVIAVADGRVVHTGWLRGFGRIVIVDHGEGHHTLSAHLERAAVGRGDEVVAGQTIGFVGDTESQNGPKLYFELRQNGRPRDPLPFLRR